jgi:hypothetical protein
MVVAAQPARPQPPPALPRRLLLFSIYGFYVNLLVIATDGILEAANAEDREFEFSGLERCIAAHRAASLPCWHQPS